MTPKVGPTVTLLDSLTDAVLRLDGDALIMHAGEKPYVVTGIVAQGVHQGPVLWGQVEISSRVLTLEALRTMLPQLLSTDDRRTLDEVGAVDVDIPATADRPRFRLVAAHGGDDIWLEVKRVKPAAVAATQTITLGTQGHNSFDAATSDPVETPAAAPEQPAAKDEPAGPAPAIIAEPVAHLGEPETPFVATGVIAAVAREEHSATELGDHAAREKPVAEAIATAKPIELQVPIEVRAEEPEPGDFGDAGSELQLVADEPQLMPSEEDVEALLAATASALLTDLSPLVDEEPRKPDAVEEPPIPVVAAGEPGPVVHPEVAPAPVGSVTEPERTAPAALFAIDRRQLLPEPVQSPPNLEPADRTIESTHAIDQLAAKTVDPAVMPPEPRAPNPEPRATSPTQIRDLLISASELGASAMYAVAHSRPMVRVDGEIVPLEGSGVLSKADIDGLRDFLAAQHAARSGDDAKRVSDIEGVGRVRHMLFQDHRGPGVIFRMQPARSLSAEKLGLPPAIVALASQTDGLILVAGAPASGRTTMLSAFLEQINSSRSDHVISIAPQIAFVHENRSSFVSQREAVGGPEAIADAVRQAVAEDPDVLFVDEVASASVAELAMETAARGRLVFASIEAASSAAALERIVEMFPGERRAHVRTVLAESLRGVVSQVMLRRAAGGRVAARELLLNVPSLAAVLVEGKAFQVPAIIESGRRIGMIPLSDALAELVRTGVVHPGEAYRKAVDRDALLAALKAQGIDTSFAERLA